MARKEETKRGVCSQRMSQQSVRRLLTRAVRVSKEKIVSIFISLAWSLEGDSHVLTLGERGS